MYFALWPIWTKYGLFVYCKFEIPHVKCRLFRIIYVGQTISTQVTKEG